MALCADKLPVLVSLVNLVVENSTVIQGGRNVAPFRATTRFNRNFLRLGIHRIHRRHVVTLRAFQISVRFMSKRTG